MNQDPNNLPIEIAFEVPASARDTFQRVLKSRKITAGTAAAQMIAFCCQLLEETPMNKADTLPAELEFNHAIRGQTHKRADPLLGVAEKVLLESRAIQGALRNRALAAVT